MSSQNSSATFLDLPSELLGPILSHIVPSGLRFKFDRQHKRKFGDLESDIDDGSSSDCLKQPSEWKPIVSATRLYYYERSGVPSTVVIDHIGELEIIPFLLLSRKLFLIVQELFYQGNKFWFLDLFSLQSFATVISSAARHSIRNITVHVCGMVRCVPDMRRVYEFEHKPDLRFAQAISVFSGLRQVRLHGVGPEAYWKTGDSANSSWATPNTWSVPCLDLIRRIIGADGQRDELDPGHALIDGQVVCKKLRMTEMGRMKIFGTWIVRKDVEYTLGQWKQRIDVCAAYDRARDYEMEQQFGKSAMEARKLRREVRLSVGGQVDPAQTAVEVAR